MSRQLWRKVFELGELLRRMLGPPYGQVMKAARQVTVEPEAATAEMLDSAMHAQFVARQVIDATKPDCGTEPGQDEFDTSMRLLLGRLH